MEQTKDSGVTDQSAAIGKYKTFMKSLVDQRPAGMRQMIAAALHRNRSFVTQILSPNYPETIPARHVVTIMETCRLSPEERRTFLDLYLQAHPDRINQLGDAADPANALRSMRVNVIAVDDSEVAAEIEIAVQKMALEISMAIARVSTLRPRR